MSAEKGCFGFKSHSFKFYLKLIIASYLEFYSWLNLICLDRASLFLAFLYLGLVVHFICFIGCDHRVLNVYIQFMFSACCKFLLVG